MAIVINGSGTVTGLSVGGLPDGTVDAGTLATNSVDSAELVDGSIDSSHLASGVGGVAGISSSADATAMTITSDENIGIGTTTPPERLSIHEPSTGTGTYLPVAITGANHATGYGVGISFKTENTSPTQKAKAAIIAEGTGEGYNKTSLHIAMSNTNDTTTEVALANSVLEFTMDGRGLSQFTAKAWVNWDGTNTPGLKDSHNVSSVTDNGTGNFTIALSNNMSNTNYSVTSMSTRSGGAADDVMVNGINGNLRTNGADFHVVRTRGDGAGANSYWDVNTNCAHFFGD